MSLPEKQWKEKKTQTIMGRELHPQLQEQDYVGPCCFPLPGIDSSICGHFLMPPSALA